MLEEDFLGGVSPVYVVARPRAAYRWFLEFSLRRPQIRTWINNFASGSVRQSLSYYDFSSIPSVIPPAQLAEEFNTRWSILHGGVRARQAESETLAALRVALLPQTHLRRAAREGSREVRRGVSVMGPMASASPFVMHGAREAFAAGLAHVEEQVRSIEQAVVENPALAFDLARTLIESVCRTILSDRKVEFSPDDDLPKLFKMAGSCLPFLPSTASGEAEVRASLARPSAA